MKRLSLSSIVVLLLALSGCSGALSTSSATQPTDTRGAQVNSASAGSSTVTVHGTVVGRDTGQPYPNAWIRFTFVTSAGVPYETLAYSDANGQYSIQLSPGLYGVSGGDECDLNVTLDPSGKFDSAGQISVASDTEIDFVEHLQDGLESYPVPC